MLQFLRRFKISKSIQISLLVQKLRRFCWIGGFCLLVELQRWRVCVCSLRSRLVFNNSKPKLSPGTLSISRKPWPHILGKRVLSCNELGFHREYINPLAWSPPPSPLNPLECLKWSFRWLFLVDHSDHQSVIYFLESSWYKPLIGISLRVAPFDFPDTLGIFVLGIVFYVLVFILFKFNIPRTTARALYKNL